METGYTYNQKPVKLGLAGVKAQQVFIKSLPKEERLTERRLFVHVFGVVTEILKRKQNSCGFLIEDGTGVVFCDLFFDKVSTQKINVGDRMRIIGFYSYKEFDKRNVLQVQHINHSKDSNEEMVFYLEIVKKMLVQKQKEVQVGSEVLGEEKPKQMVEDTEEDDRNLKNLERDPKKDDKSTKKPLKKTQNFSINNIEANTPQNLKGGDPNTYQNQIEEQELESMIEQSMNMAEEGKPPLKQHSQSQQLQYEEIVYNIDEISGKLVKIFYEMARSEIEDKDMNQLAHISVLFRLPLLEMKTQIGSLLQKFKNLEILKNFNIDNRSLKIETSWIEDLMSKLIEFIEQKNSITSKQIAKFGQEYFHPQKIIFPSGLEHDMIAYLEDEGAITVEEGKISLL